MASVGQVEVELQLEFCMSETEIGEKAAVFEECLDWRVPVELGMMEA